MATFFVNASWNKTDDFTLTWNKHLYTPEWYDPETEAQKIVDGEPTLVYSTDKDASYYAKDLQAAINFAHPGDTIVFYNINGGSDQSDFKFYDPRGTLIVDKNLTFRTGSTTETSKDFYYGKAVKFDSLKVKTGSTLTLGKGLFSLDDVLIIDKTATLELVNNSHCNADIIQNAESGTILVDTSSRLVAASIDEGNVKIKTGEVAGEKLKWIDRPVVANIGKDVQLFFVYPGNTDGTLLNLTDSSEYKHIYVAKKKTAATSELLSVYYYTDGDDGNPQTPDAVKNHPDDYAVYDFRPTTEYESLFLINNVFDLNNPVNGTYSTAAMYVNKDWTTLPTGSFTAKRQELGGSGTVNISTTFTDPTNNSSVNITQNSIVAALNSAYVTTHTIGKDNEGVIIRVQKTENDYEELGTLSVITRNVILEPDKYWDATNGKWVYDDVSVHFGHEVNGEWTGGDLVVEHIQNLFTIKHLNTLDIRDWVIGGVNEQNGVMSFVDIGNLVIHYRLKAEYGATVLIDNCTVHSKRHFSIVGGTMIVKNSTVYLDKGYTNSSVGWGGVVSTENSTLGSGSFILHNSNFIVKQGNTSEYSVNLKDDAEFIISGKCLVNGTFTDLKGVSDTHITFRDAVLAPVVIVNPETGNPETVYSEIRPQDSLPGRGANLHFEGNNTLDHATVAQTGGQDMVIDAGATLDLSNGAAITLPNYGSNISEITNNGIVSLSNGSSITGGTITNAPDSTMTVDGTSQLYTDHFENGEGAIFTIALNPDGTLPIRPVTQNGSVTIDNQGTIVMDAGGLDYTPNNIPLEGINGNGEVVLKVQGGGIDIKTDEEGNQYIQMARPDVSTIYVNRAWSDKATGQNVGLFTYYGYNAFSDNGNPNFSRDPMWSVLKAGSTKRIIYTGADDKYGDLNLSFATAEHGVTVRTVANGAKNDAKFGTLTVGPSTPVMLSGATVDADAISVQKNGELYVTPGESAKLQLTVAEGDEPRDVQIQVINNGTKETETFTVRVPAGETVVSLSSNKFVVGQSYYVVVTDKSVNTAVHDTSEGTRKITINVAFVEEAKRTVDVTVRGVDTENKNALYTFRNVEIAKQVTSVPLSPSFGGGSEVVSVKMDDGTVVPVSDYSLVYDGGVLTLTVNRPAADPEHPEITSRLFTANIANDDNSQFLAYTFEVAVGTGDETVTLPTSFIENTEYYVMVEEPMITATAVTDSLDRSDVTTDAIVNNGRLQVASENDTRKITLTGAAGKARTVHVVVTADDFVMQTDVLIPLNDSPVPVNIYSDDFVAGVEYAIEITDAGDLLPMQTSVAEDVRRKAAMLTLTGLDVDSASSRKITVQVGGKTYTTFVPAGSAVAKLASEDFKVGKTYTGVTVTDGETTKTYASLKAETLSRFSADSVTNNDSIVIMDADFTAGTLDNRAGKTIEAENADIKVTSAFTNAGDVSVSGSAITVGESETPGSLVNSGSIALNTLAAAGDDPAIQSSLTVYGDVTNTGTISYVFIYTNVDDDPETTDVNESQVASSAAQKFHVIGGSVNNAGGTITIDASAFNLEDASKQVTDFAVNGGIVTATGKDEIKAVRDSSKHVYLFNVGAVDMSTLYVDNMDGWSGDIGAEITSGKDWIPGETKPDLYFRINAFTDAATAAEGLAATTDTIVFKGNTGNSYGDLDLSAASDITLSVEPDGSTSVSVGNLTAGNSVTLSALDLAATGVTNTGTLTIDGTASLTASGNVTNTGTISYKFVNGMPSAQVFKVDGSGSVNNAGGTITIDVSDAVFPEAGDRLIQVTDFAVNGGVISITGTAHGLVPGETVTAIRDADNNVWLIATPADTTVLYVDNDSVDAWSGQPGTLIADPTNPDDPYAGWNPDEEKLYYGVNAFSDNGAVNGITADTTTIKIKGGNETSYGDFLFTTITNGITVTTDAGVAKIDALTAGEGKTVTLDSAKLNATGAVTNSGTLTQTGATTGVLSATTLTNSGTFTQTAGTVNAGTLTNAANAEMTFADTVSATTALVNSGTVDQTSGTIEATTLTNDAGAEMTIAGTVEATTLTNTGTLTQTDGTVNAVTFGNSGMFTQSSGTVNVTGTDTFTNNATMTLGGEFHVTSDFTNVGTLNQLGGSMTMGAFTNSANAFAAFAGSATMGDITNETGGKLYQTDGEIRAASLANSGEVELHYGTMKLTDGITNNAGATIKLRDTLIKDDEGNNVKVAGALSGTSLTNAGTFTQTAGVVELTGDITNSSMFTQTSGALSAASLANSAGASASLGGVVELTGAITNSGTFAQTSGTLSAASLTNSAGASASLGGEVELTNIENFGAFVQTGGHLSAGTITQANNQKNDAAMVFNGTLNATSLGNSVEYGAAIELNLKGCENTLESIRNSKGGTIKLTGGTLTVTGVGRSTTDGGISNSGDYFNVGISATEASDAVLNVKNLDMISGNGDGRGGLFVYKNAVLNVGTETENGVLRCNYGYDQRRIDVNGGTVNVFGNVENAGKAGSLGGAFSIIGISMVYVKGTFSGNGNLIFKGVTLDSRTRIVADNGATKNLIVKKDGGKSSLIDGAVISVTSMTVDDGAMTISDTAGTGSFTVTNDITNKKRLKVKDGATLDVGGNITNSEAGKVIDIFAGATINLTGGSDKKISGGILDVGTVNESTGANILTEDFYILVTGAIDDGVTLNVDKLDGKTSWAKTITVGEVSSTTITVGDLRSNGDSGAIGGTDYKVTTLDGKGLYLTKNDPSVLYVSADYTGEAGTITADGHLVGYNAFSSLDAITDPKAPYSSYHSGAEGATGKYSKTKEINLAAGATGTAGGNPKVYRWFYSDPVDSSDPYDVAITGAGGSEGTETTIRYDRLYLMTALTATTDAEYSAKVATEAANRRKFIIDKDLTLKMNVGHGLLKVGDVLDKGDAANRTGGVADLQVDGILEAAVYAAPYSTVTVTGSGKLINTRNGSDPKQGSYLRNYSQMTVNGADTPAENTNKQIEMKNLTFIDGGTLNLNSTRARISHFRLSGAELNNNGDPVNLLNPTDAVITLNNTWFDTDALPTSETNPLRYFFLYNYDSDPDYPEDIFLNVENASTLKVNGIFNPSAKMTVSLSASELIANSIENAGAINLKSGSTVSAANITNTGTITVEAGSTVNVANTGSISGGSIDIITVDSNDVSILTDDFYILVNGTIDYANVTITVDGGASAGGLDFNPATDDPLDITTKYKLTTLGGRGLFLTNKDPSVLYVGANYTDAGTIVDGHLVGYNAFSSFTEALAKAEAFGSTSIQIVSENYSETVSPSADKDYFFKENLTIGGENVSLSGVGELILRAQDRKITINNDIESAGWLTVSWPKTVTETKYAATTEINSTLASGTNIQIGSIATVSTTGKLSAGNSILVMGPNANTSPSFVGPTPDVTITGTGSYEDGTHDEQIYAQYMILVDGGVSITDSKVYLEQALSFTDENYRRSGGFVTDAHMVSNNTRWDVQDIVVRYYAGTDGEDITDDVRNFVSLTESGGIFTFQSGSVLNVRGNLTNVPYKRIGEGGELAGVIDGAPALTINLDDSTMSVAGYIRNAGTITMDKDSLITANSITNSGAGKVEIDAAGFSGMKKVIDLNGSGENPDESITVKAETKPADVALFFDGQDYWLTDADRSTVYVNTAWTGEYGEAVATRKYFGYNATDAISSAVDIAPSTILVTKGTFGGSKAFELKGIATTIQGSVTETVFQKGVYGGATATAAAAEATAVSRNIDLTIEGGSFEKVVVGGDKVQMGSAGDKYYISGTKQTLCISGGLFVNSVAAGDRFEKGELHRTGKVSLNISGGTFGLSEPGAGNIAVAGGMMVATTRTDAGSVTIQGDVEMSITGGTFADTAWIYGGGVATNRNASAASTIDGSTTITVNADGVKYSGIVLSHVAAGSYGLGTITGDAKIEFIGDGQKDGNAVKFTENGELWGSCGGDSVSPLTGELLAAHVNGDRTLTFTGFDGKLDCSNIRAFSKVEIKDRTKTVNEESTTFHSSVTMDNANFNLSGIKTWEFDCGSTLSGGFTNDFTGDTLILVGFTGITAPQTIMTDTLNTDDRDVFGGFEALSTIWMNSTRVDLSPDDFDSVNNVWTFSAGDYGTFNLSLSSSETSTSMVLAKA